MKYAKDRKAFVMALVLMALMFVLVPIATADAGSQDWYLCTAGDLDTTPPGDGSEVISEVGTSHYWLAPVAQCALTMGAGDWDLTLYCNAPCAGSLDVAVRHRNDGTYLTSHHTIDLSSGDNYKSETMSGNAKDFEIGECFGLRAVWTPSTPDEKLTVKYGSSFSTLASPSTDPGWPVPELSTLALFSVGLLALVGYVAYRRRDR